MSGIDLDSYVGVNERLVELREKHPEASLQPVNLDTPYEIVTVDGKWFIVYAAACYRTPEDTRPGIGVAWEPVPGKTSFTRDSELQNAETSAWGRAIVAALAADTKRGVASADEVRGRSETATVTSEVDITSITLADVDSLRPRDLFAALGVDGGNVNEAREQLRAKLAEVAGGSGEAPPAAEAEQSAEGSGAEPTGRGTKVPASAQESGLEGERATAPPSAALAGEGASTLGEDPDAPSPSANRIAHLKARNVALLGAGVSIDAERKARGIPSLSKCLAKDLDDFEFMLTALEAREAERAAQLREQDERRVG